MIYLGQQGRFRRQLQMAHAALPPSAGQRGADACCHSGRCCWSGPCELSPSDPPKIAAHLGVTETDLFARYLVVDESRFRDGFRVIPRRRQWTAGRYLTNAETYDADTPCVFLGDGNACQIHDAKPAGGVFYKCWDPDTHGEPPGVEWSKEQVMALGWDGDEWPSE